MIHLPISKTRPQRSIAFYISVLGLCFAISQFAKAAEPSSPAEVLTLSKAISIALDKNIDLQRSALSVESRSSSLDQAKAEFSPDLSLRLGESIGVSSNDSGGIFEGEGQWSDSTSASLSTSLTLYDGGARDATLTQAQAELEAASLDFDRDRQGLLYDTVALFFQTVLRSKEIAIQEEELATRREELNRINIDVENGIRTTSEALRQQSQVSISERTLAQARNNYANSLYSLKNILRLSPATAIICEDPAPDIGFEAILLDPNISQSLATLEQRVDLSAQKARLTSAEQSLRIAKSGKRASVSASGSLSTGYSSNTNETFGNQFLRDQPRASAGISVNLPIFDRRRTELNTVRSRIFLQQEELYLESLQLSARTALYQANQDYETAKLQLAASIEQLASSSSALEAELSRYEAGAATLLDVNSLRTIRLESAVAVEEARFALFTSRLSVAFQDGTIETFLKSTLELSN